MRLFGREISIANAAPVISRESRAESRRPINYWLRVLAASVMVAVFAVFMASTQLNTSRLGAALFGVLQQALSLAIWIIVPVMTADCISREKREGTLGLLFLTPLSVLDVIMGKAATHVLRAATLLLASLPVLVLPFVVGGVAWQWVLIAIATVTNALFLGIAAGLYASAKGGTLIQVMVLAEGYAIVLAVISAVAHGILEVLVHILRYTAGSSLLPLGCRLGGSVAFTLVTFLIVISASVRLLRATWDQDSAAPERPKWVALFSEDEFWRNLFHWEKGRTLDRNPIAWLQEYSWTARLTKWGWFFGLIFAELVIVVGNTGWQPQLIAVLALGVAFSATASFRRERQTGMLEILLVTPLSARQLVAGRLWGIFIHFLPALALLAIFWNGDRLLNSKTFDANPLALIWPNPFAFVALMVVGLYMSLWRLNFIAVWLLAWALAFFLPAVTAVSLSRLAGLHPIMIVSVTSAFQIALTATCWVLLRRNMEQRKFLEATTMGAT